MEAYVQELKQQRWLGTSWAGNLRSFPRSKSSRGRSLNTIIPMCLCMATSQRSRKNNMDQLTFLSEEPHVNHSASQDLEADWMMTVATSPLNTLGLLNEKGPDGWYGKTSPASCQQTEDGTLVPFSGGLVELGYGFAYRVLDAQYFGVPQRRRRVFLIGYLGDWRPPAAVLFERESLRRDSPPSREARKRIATAFETGPSGSRYTDLAPTLDTRCKDGPIRNQLGMGVFNRMTALGEYVEDDTASTIKSRDYKDATDIIAFSCKDYGNDVQTNVTPTMRSMNSVNGRQNGGGQLAVLTCGDRGMSVDQACGNMAVPVSVSESQSGYIRETDTAQALGCAGGKPGQGYQAIRNANAVRRLTPRECERLQGFPDDYTKIPWRKKGPEDCPDGPRYKALGNSMAVPVMNWIGRRIQKVDDILKSQGPTA